MIDWSRLSFTPQPDEFNGSEKPAMQTRDLAVEEAPDAIGTRRMRVGIHETIVWVNVIVALPRSDRSGCFGRLPREILPQRPGRRSAPRQDFLDIENSLPNGTSSHL